MQELINEIISENVQVDAVGIRDIYYNNRSTKVIRSKVDEHFYELITSQLETEDKITYFELPAPKKRAMIVEALIEAERDQNNDDNGRSEREALTERLELYVVQDGENQDHVRVWDSEAKTFNKSYASMKTFLGEKSLALLPKYLCTEQYNPEISFDSEQIEWQKDGQIEVASVNTYIHPSWRSEPTLNASLVSCLESKEHLSLPTPARAFFKHLFPERESRHYVYEYLYHAMTQRNGCEHILVLHGGTGTGKTIFATDLVGGLVGYSNWSLAPKNLFKSVFNKVLVDKRIIYYDEAKVNRDTYAVVKLYANNRMNIEKKGVDADNTTELFFSLIASANKMGEYYIHYDDRRSSIVETTEVKLLEVWSKKQINDFTNALREEDFIGQIGNFILSRSWTDKKPEFVQFRGKKFYEFVYRHLSTWEKNVITSVQKAGSRGQDQITVASLLSKIDNDKRISHDLQEDTLLEFIADYKHLGEYYVGTIKEDEEIGKFLEIDDFFKTEEEDDDEMEDLL